MTVLDRVPADDEIQADEWWAEEIRRLAKKRNATILAHNYQLPAIQDVADHVGDSLALSRIARVLRDQDTVTKIRGTKDAQAIHTFLSQAPASHAA